MAAGERPKGFGSADVRRIGQAVRYVESLPRGSGSAPSQPFAAAYTSARWVRLTSNIAARSGAQCYSGPITFQSVSDTGQFSDTTETGTAWNGTTKAMTGGTARFYQAQWANGKWWLWPSACADVT